MYVSSLSLPQRKHHGNKNNISSRRDVLIETTTTTAAAVLGGPLVANISPANAEATTATATTASSNEGSGRIAIIGANGRTGSLCVNACLRRGIPVTALTRTGVWRAPEEDDLVYDKSLLTIGQCDVTKGLDNNESNGDNESTSINEIRNNIKGCNSVIYAASASKQGGTPYQVDDIGVVNTAKACIKENISKFILISSTATTRPKSLGYIFTNLSVGGIMDEKRKGELAVIDCYNKNNELLSSSSSTSSLPSYTIIRPGGLEEPKQNKILGPTSLEVSQGDVLAGIISRADLAEFTIEVASTSTSGSSSSSSPQNTKNTAIEVYYTNSVVACESKFKKQFLTSSSAAGSSSNNKEQEEKELPPTRLHGSSYVTLLEGVRSNIDFY
jgi:nucleoside-diphosphate-sugar epimerase